MEGKKKEGRRGKEGRKEEVAEREAMREKGDKRGERKRAINPQ